MPFGTYDLPEPERKPTFLQYLKTTKLAKGVEGKTKYPVEVIWLPGKFDNVTLQTHAFRYVATPNHPLYNDCIEYCKMLKREYDTFEGTVFTTPRLDIVITSIADKSIEVTPNAAKPIGMKPIGEYGLRFAE